MVISFITVERKAQIFEMQFAYIYVASRNVVLGTLKILGAQPPLERKVTELF